MKPLQTPWFTTMATLAIIGGIVVLAVRGDALSANVKTLIIGNLITILASLLAVKKVENVQHDIRNGIMTEKVKDAITEMAEDPNTGTVIITPDYEGPDRRHHEI